MSGVSIRAGAVIRTLAFIVLALALCGVVFELAGYSALLTQVGTFSDRPSLTEPVLRR